MGLSWEMGGKREVGTLPGRCPGDAPAAAGTGRQLTRKQFGSHLMMAHPGEQITQGTGEGGSEMEMMVDG